MSVRDQLEGLIEFAGKARCFWDEPKGPLPLIRGEWEVVFALASGDPNLYCFRENENFVVRKEERGKYSGPWIISDRLEDIEKFLSFDLGNDVRRKAGFPRIWLDTTAVDLGGEFDGFHFEGTIADLTVSWQEGNSTRSVSGLNASRAKDFVRYVKFSAEEIRGSFLEEDGHPLFTAV